MGPQLGSKSTSVASSYLGGCPTRGGISLRNAPKRNPTYTTVSPHEAPRACAPARSRDDLSRHAPCKPSRQESTGIELQRAVLRTQFARQWAVANWNSSPYGQPDSRRLLSIPVDSPWPARPLIWACPNTLTGPPDGPFGQARTRCRAGPKASPGRPKSHDGQARLPNLQVETARRFRCALLVNTGLNRQDSTGIGRNRVCLHGDIRTWDFTAERSEA